MSEMDEENIQGMVLGDSIANVTGIKGALNVGPVMIVERGIDNEVVVHSWSNGLFTLASCGLHVPQA